MTQYDAELLAQFASTWPVLKGDPGRRACLRIDLCNFMEDYNLGFDRDAYWAMIERIDADDAKQNITR